MKVYIIYTHPNPKSFNHAILESFTKGLAEAGHSFEISDLYADNFKADLEVKDLEQFHAGKMPEDIKFYQDKISASDAMVFIYPVWWISPPALLKGWLDRVFSLGFAFGSGESGLIPLLKQRKALIMNTCGLTEKDYQDYGFKDAICKAMGDGTLRFCGIQNVEHVFFYNVVGTDDNTRKGYLEQANLLGKNF